MLHGGAVRRAARGRGGDRRDRRTARSASRCSSTISRPGPGGAGSISRICTSPRRRAGRASARRCCAHLAGIALDRGCARFEWSVLDWNDAAIGFYRAMARSSAMDEWTRRSASPATRLREARRGRARGSFTSMFIAIEMRSPVPDAGGRRGGARRDQDQVAGRGRHAALDRLRLAVDPARRNPGSRMNGIGKRGSSKNSSPPLRRCRRRAHVDVIDRGPQHAGMRVAHVERAGRRHVRPHLDGPLERRRIAPVEMRRALRHLTAVSASAARWAAPVEHVGGRMPAADIGSGEARHGGMPVRIAVANAAVSAVGIGQPPVQDRRLEQSDLRRADADAVERGDAVSADQRPAASSAFIGSSPLAFSAL